LPFKLKQLVPHYVPEYEGYDDAVKNFLKGKEEAEDKSAKEEDEEVETDATDATDAIEPLILADDEILERHLQLGCPEDRDDVMWAKLTDLLRATQPGPKNVAGGKKKRAKQTPEEKTQAKASTTEIKLLRAALKILKPSKKKKKKGVEGPDEGFSKVPLEDIVRYAATDSDVTRLILKAQTHRNAQMNTREESDDVMKYLYLPGSRTLSRMEWRGFAVDQTKLDTMMAAAEERSLAAKEVLRSKFDPTLNPNSPKQVMALMARMNFEALDGEGLGSTGKLILERYEKKYPQDDPRNIFVTKLREFRETDKVWKKDLKKNLKRHSRDDGKVHCSFNLNGTATGRLCVSADTLLKTTCGTYKIAELPEELLGTARIKTHLWRFRQILRRFFKGNEEMFRVVQDNGDSIVCTAGHQFMTPVGWRHLHELVVGNYVGSNTTRTIRSITAVGVQAVWDIEVEEDHSYVACGFINHNSSSSPNMQNVKHIAARVVAKGPDGKELKGPDGKEIVLFPGYNIKSLFIPSKPENVIVNLDIKGAELRVYTAYSHDKMFIDALNHGLDAHSLVTSKVHSLPYEEVMAQKETDLTIKKWRDDCKKALFCTLYGGGPWRVAQQTGLTKEEGEELQNFIFSSFPDLKAYVETVTKQVRDVQQLKTVFGRYRRFRLAHMSNELMSAANREAVNFLIQSTSSDLVLSQLCEIDDHLEGELGGQLLITVHDSMTLEMPEKSVDKLFPFMDYWITQRIKDKFDWLPVPFLFDIAVGPNYGELVTLERKGKENSDGQATQVAGAPAGSDASPAIRTY